MILSTVQRDRARAAVLGSAIGDAVGAAYEFGSREVGPEGPAMLGGGLGNFAPGEWTDDTAMAWCVLDAAATVEDVALVDAARRVSALTHHDPDAQDACVLWSLAIRHGVLHEELDLRSGLVHLDPAAVERWDHRIAEAEQRAPGTFRPNGWVVTALQAAWSAIVHTPVPPEEPARHLADALAAAIDIGDDTDTVAAIAGGLLGARWGTTALRPEWTRVLHGYPAWPVTAWWRWSTACSTAQRDGTVMAA